jgi:hypothetical protein
VHWIYPFRQTVPVRHDSGGMGGSGFLVLVGWTMYDPVFVMILLQKLRRLVQVGDIVEWYRIE